MSFRNRRSIITGSLTDEQAPTAAKDKFDELKIACDDRAAALELTKNKIFVALTNYFDELEERDYADLRGMLGVEKTNFTRGRLSYFTQFREFCSLIIQK